MLVILTVLQSHDVYAEGRNGLELSEAHINGIFNHNFNLNHADLKEACKEMADGLEALLTSGSRTFSSNPFPGRSAY